MILPTAIIHVLTTMSLLCNLSLAPDQLQGYSRNNPVWDNLYEVAYSCMVDWHNGEGRILDSDMCFFSGWGGINHFRNAWLTKDATKFWEEE